MKCFQSKRLDCLVKAYVTYVRPLLEYNSPVWSPHWAKDIRTLERVQKRFSKKLPALHDLSYSDRLERLGIERLEARRIRARSAAVDRAGDLRSRHESESVI